jgi:hypothetical protein
LLAYAAVQPPVWQWIHQAMTRLFS